MEKWDVPGASILHLLARFHPPFAQAFPSLPPKSPSRVQSPVPKAVRNANGGCREDGHDDDPGNSEPRNKWHGESHPQEIPEIVPVVDDKPDERRNIGAKASQVVVSVAGWMLGCVTKRFAFHWKHHGRSPGEKDEVEEDDETGRAGGGGARHIDAAIGGGRWCIRCAVQMSKFGLLG